MGLLSISGMNHNIKKLFHGSKNTSRGGLKLARTFTHLILKMTFRESVLHVTTRLSEHIPYAYMCMYCTYAIAVTS